MFSSWILIRYIPNLYAAVCRYSETGTETGMRQQRADEIRCFVEICDENLIPLGLTVWVVEEGWSVLARASVFSKLEL